MPNLKILSYVKPTLYFQFIHPINPVQSYFRFTLAFADFSNFELSQFLDYFTHYLLPPFLVYSFKGMLT